MLGKAIGEAVDCRFKRQVISASACSEAHAGHAAIPKKSFGVTAPPVALNIFPMSSREGMVVPSDARVMVDTDTSTASASLVAVLPSWAR